MSKLAEKGMRLQQALVLVQFLRQVDEVGFPAVMVELTRMER